MICGFAVIPALKKLKAGQSILHYVKEHESKGGTPTMGGIFFIIPAAAVILSFCVKSGFRNAAVICVTGLSFGLVGFLDDFIKVKFRRNEGLKPYQKIFFQLSVAVIISAYACLHGYTQLILPFSGRTWELGGWAFILYEFVFIATTNCVNLTDGLDGLAAGVSYVFFAVIGFIICLEGAEPVFAVSAFSLCGALLGFLAFNTYRAKVFMGDTGSLAIGGFVSVICIFSGNALLIPVVGVVFVFTGISVILQVVSFKSTGKRIFLMSPIHHHFQMKGASESKIAFCYKLITLLFGLACLIRFL